MVDKDSAENKTLGCNQPFGKHGPMHIKNDLEMLVEILDGDRAYFVQHFANTYTIIMPWIRVVFPSERSHEVTISLFTQ